MSNKGLHSLHSSLICSLAFLCALYVGACVEDSRRKNRQQSILLLRDVAAVFKMAKDLSEPFASDILLEVRSGRMRLMKGLSILSGINKEMVTGPVEVSMSGIIDDEHDLVFHGGPDKAILGCKLLSRREAPGTAEAD